MKSNKVQSICTALYCAAAGALSVWVVISFIQGYSTFAERVPVYLYPWGGAWGVADKNLFYVFRMPVMALCLQVMLFGIYPDRIEGWSDAIYAHLRATLTGLSLVVLSQLTLNAYCTFSGAVAHIASVAICALLVVGIILTVLGWLRLRALIKPLCSPIQSPSSLLIDFMFKGCKRKRVLLIAATVAFMVLLVVPSLSL